MTSKTWVNSSKNHKLPKFNKDDIDKLNTLLIIKEIIILHPPPKKNYSLVSLTNLDTKILNKIKQLNSAMHKKLYTTMKWDLLHTLENQ